MAASLRKNSSGEETGQNRQAAGRKRIPFLPHSRDDTMKRRHSLPPIQSDEPQTGWHPGSRITLDPDAGHNTHNERLSMSSRRQPPHRASQKPPAVHFKGGLFHFPGSRTSSANHGLRSGRKKSSRRVARFASASSPSGRRRRWYLSPISNRDSGESLRSRKAQK